jgi:hypothetical protein
VRSNVLADAVADNAEHAHASGVHVDAGCTAAGTGVGRPRDLTASSHSKIGGHTPVAMVSVVRLDRGAAAVGGDGGPGQVAGAG